jgi:hypothetical protein
MRLQVILKDAEYREIRRAAGSRHLSIAEWVRLALLQSARQQEPMDSMAKKLESIRIAAQFEFPAGDADKLHSELDT